MEVRDIAEYINFLSVQLKTRMGSSPAAPFPAPRDMTCDPHLESLRIGALNEKPNIEMLNNILDALSFAEDPDDTNDTSYDNITQSVTLDQTWQYINCLNEELEAAKAEIRRLKNY